MEITALERPTKLEWRCVGGHEPWQDNTFRQAPLGLRSNQPLDAYTSSSWSRVACSLSTTTWAKRRMSS